jgi:alpha-tubulin suppressor-like RCC1 family protein
MRAAAVTVAVLAASASGESAALRGDRHLAVDKTNFAVTDMTCSQLGGQAVLKSSGTLWSWWSTDPVSSITPPSGQEVISVGGRPKAGQHFCVILKQDKALRCWGDNVNGELGNGDVVAIATLSATTVNALTGVTDFAVGSSHTCALKSGSVFCWGGNDKGQLGRDTDGEDDATKTIPTLAGGVSQLACSIKTCCAIQSGDLYCWGDNEKGQLGVNDEAGFFDAPQRVKIPYSARIGKAVADVSVADFHACAVMKTSGAAFCWGNNDSGELGAGLTIADQKYTTPQRVKLPKGRYAAHVAASNDATCFVYTNGQIACAGNAGNLGAPLAPTPNINTPATFKTTVFPKDIEAGDGHFCVRDKSNMVVCWGTTGLGGSVYPADLTTAKTYIEFVS